MYRGNYNPATVLPTLPVKQESEEFCQAMRDVASGRKTVDEAWAWLEQQRALTSPPHPAKSSGSLSGSDSSRRPQ